MSCNKTTRSGCQSFPKAGILAINSNLSLNDLKKKVAKTSPAMVYCYIVRSIKTNNGISVQKGCGPNWQGGLITLCTCKHYMRTFFDHDAWKGKWIAGFTSKSDGVNGRNALIYLMKVKVAFESHYDLWNALSVRAREAKAADRSFYGDVFRPREHLITFNKHDPFMYYQPEAHAHLDYDGWQKDISYKYHNRYAALLVGDKKNSFLWNSPCIVAQDRLARGQKKISLNNLFGTFLGNA